MQPNLLLFNKPYLVVSQFSPLDSKQTLKEFIDLLDYYPAGRLDHDSEGLLALTNNSALQARITDPQFKLPKTYWVQVEGDISSSALSLLAEGVRLKDGLTRPATANKIQAPDFPPRNPPIRTRKNIPTSWIELTIREGRNRQVRRMTANVGFPTLRLIRAGIGDWTLGELAPGDYRLLNVNLPTLKRRRSNNKGRPRTKKNASDLNIGKIGSKKNNGENKT
jgi:23S rRNA pseudouridine2457 synthase